MISGLVVTFGKNPYSTKLKGFCINLWILGVVIIAKEYIRYRLINNVYEKDKTTIAILISVVYILFEMQINTFFSQEVTTILLIKKTAQEFLPLIAKNVLYSYIAKIYMWTSPILPNLPWIMVSIINTFIPVVLYIYIRFEKNKNDYYKNRENLTKLDPKNMIVLFILIIMAIWFSLGIFPLKPVAIASGSMEKAINIGDIVIIKKCNANDVIVGDVIQYQMKGFTVIHRVIEKRQKNGEYYFVTKGDNNKSPDKAEVRENQVLGKLVFTVKYLGYPAVWLHLISTEDQVKI
jgi:signal peptidase